MPGPINIGAVRAARQALLRRGEAVARELVRQYQRTGALLVQDFDGLASIAAGLGIDAPPAYLLRIDKVQSLLAQIDVQLAKLHASSAAIAERAARVDVRQAADDAEGALPRAARDRFQTLPSEALEALIGHATGDTPLAKRFERAGVESAQRYREVLFDGMARGLHPRVTGRLLAASVTDTSLHNAMVIARTEQYRAYRQSAIEHYAYNSEVVDAWQWCASLSPRTCGACLILNGSTHPNTEIFGSHPSCRCTPIPVVLGEPMALPSGEAWLEKQDKKHQDFVLGRARAELWRQGAVPLSKMLARDSSDYGPGAGLKSLRRLMEEGSVSDYVVADLRKYFGSPTAKAAGPPPKIPKKKIYDLGMPTQKAPAWLQTPLPGELPVGGSPMIQALTDAGEEEPEVPEKIQPVKSESSYLFGGSEYSLDVLTIVQAAPGVVRDLSAIDAAREEIEGEWDAMRKEAGLLTLGEVGFGDGAMLHFSKKSGKLMNVTSWAKIGDDDLYVTGIASAGKMPLTLINALADVATKAGYSGRNLVWQMPIGSSGIPEKLGFVNTFVGADTEKWTLPKELLGVFVAEAKSVSDVEKIGAAVQGAAQAKAAAPAPPKKKIDDAIEKLLGKPKPTLDEYKMKFVEWEMADQAYKLEPKGTPAYAEAKGQAVKLWYEYQDMKKALGTKFAPKMHTVEKAMIKDKLNAPPPPPPAEPKTIEDLQALHAEWKAADAVKKDSKVKMAHAVKLWNELQALKKELGVKVVPRAGSKAAAQAKAIGGPRAGWRQMKSVSEEELVDAEASQMRTWYNGPGWNGTSQSDAELKADICNQLENTLSNDEDWREYVCTRMNSDTYTAESGRRVMRDFIHQWAETSMDSSTISIAIQLAARAEFGLDDSLLSHVDRSSTERGERFFRDNGSALRKVLRAQYDWTQKFLKEVGIDVVHAYRGWAASSRAGLPKKGDDGIIGLDMQPLSSFAVRARTAVGFMSHGSGGSMLSYCQIPRERILSTCRTGFGCRGEYELVVLGGSDIPSVTHSGKTEVDLHATIKRRVASVLD